MEDAPPARPPPMPPQAQTKPAVQLSVTAPADTNYDNNEGEWDDDWDGTSAASDNYSGEYKFDSGPGQRTASMARAGTVKRSMNR